MELPVEIPGWLESPGGPPVAILRPLKAEARQLTL